MGQKKTTQKTSSSNTFDKWVGNESRAIADAARGLSGQNPFNEMHTAAYANAMDTSNPFMSAMEGIDIGSLMGNKFTGADANPFINKYMEASAPALADINETMHGALNNQHAGAGSAFGGSRSFLADAAIAGEAANARGNIFSNAVNQGMNMGFQAHNADLANKRAGFGIFGNAGSQYQANKNSNFANLMAGAQNKFSMPWQNLQNRTSIFGSVPKNTYSSGKTTQSKPSNVLGNVLGVAGTLGGAFLGGPAGASLGASLFGGGESGGFPLPKPKPTLV